MPRLRSPRHIRIFLASPGDVLEERKAARELLLRLEREPLVRGDFTIEVVSWDDPDGPVPMLATLTPQQAVARALPRPSECDVTVAILWGRSGTPLEEQKPDGSPYLSGTEWEFEDARRARKPILLYRKTTTLPAPREDADEAERQRRNLERFFEQFKGPGGTLRGGFATYDTIEEFTRRLRTDVESLLPTLRQNDEVLPSDAGWLQRTRTKVRQWGAGRLLLILPLGLLVTVVAATAVGTFPKLAEGRNVPVLAYVVRYLLMVIATIIPLALLVVVWWWLGRKKPYQEG
jgi:hypothetical protein